jgi:DNA polymerase-3 subunit chi
VSATCEVDFYVLGASAPSAGHLACRLCLKAWEEGHRVSVLAADEQDARRLDRLMWEFPAGRFLPHEVGAADAAVPVVIVHEPESLAGDRDVIVNLSPSAVPEPGRFQRLLEIVPADATQRDSSRDKFRAYRSQGLKPNHHQMQAF